MHFSHILTNIAFAFSDRITMILTEIHFLKASQAGLTPWLCE